MRRKGRGYGFYLIYLCWMLIVNVFGQEIKSSNSNEPYSAVLQGRVKSIEIKKSPSEVLIHVKLEMELVNNGLNPVMFLDTEMQRPHIRGGVLTKTQSYSKESYLTSEYAGESVSGHPDWEKLREALDKPLPPVDKVRILKPGESWKWETSVYIGLPAEPNTYLLNKPLWEEVERLSKVWLRVICQVWSLNIEWSFRRSLLKPKFGYKLQKRWKKVGLLLVDDMFSEPIMLDLKEAVIRGN